MKDDNLIDIHVTIIDKMQILNYIKILKPRFSVVTHLSFLLGVFALYSSERIQVPLWWLLCIIFYLFYGAIYIMNDLFDYEGDKADPLLRLRPIPAGIVPYHHAVIEMLVLITVSLLIAFFVQFEFFIALLILLVMNIIYSGFLKKVAYLDFLFMAFSHPMKFVTGGLVFGSLTFSFPLIPVLIAMYAVSIIVHADKQYVRLLQGRKRKFLFGEYTIPGLTICSVIAITLLISQLFFISGWLQIVFALLAVVAIVIALGKPLSRRVRRFQQNVEMEVSK